MNPTSFYLIKSLTMLIIFWLIQIVSDPEIMVSFPIVGDPQAASFVAWTTTPWTLPSNLALCVNANFTYVKVGYLSITIEFAS